MSQSIKKALQSIFSTPTVKELEVIQSLWSGYGKISRWYLEGALVKTVIVKQIQANSQQNHPRGWNTSLSHERKLKSYQVEMNWYENHAGKCDNLCRVPQCYCVSRVEEEQHLILEDLDAAGFSLRRNELNVAQIKVCLSWLAHFHATFMQVKSDGLWKVGTYWHLETRPDEFEKLEKGWLKEHAQAIDQKLSGAKYQTLVHGDAKLANFCFSEDMQQVAAVDFQYVGGGCGMKDVAYLLSSCLSGEECKNHENELLKHYFLELEIALSKLGNVFNFNELESEWRDLYPYAWADFVRFLKGWAADHYKLNEYSEGMVEMVRGSLKSE